MVKTFTQLYGTGPSAALAEKLYSAWMPGDLVHVENLMGVKLTKGFTRDITYRVAVAFPDYAKKLVNRKRAAK